MTMTSLVLTTARPSCRALSCPGVPVNVRAIVSVGNFSVEAHVEDCGPDALGDAMRQAIGCLHAAVANDDLRAAAEAEVDDDD